MHGFWSSLQEQRLGFAMIGASVAALAAAALLVQQLHETNRTERLRAQGPNVSRLLADIPVELLSGPDQATGPLRILQAGTQKDQFAYALVQNAQGSIVNAVSQPEVDLNVLPITPPQDPWSGERAYTLPGLSRDVLEYFSPMVVDGKLTGVVRIGYFNSGPGFELSQLPQVATLALIIFLLTPIFYVMVRRELQPIKSMNREISEQLKEGALGNLSIEPSGEFKEFIDQFNSFAKAARNRIDVLEHDKSELVSAQQLLTYRKQRSDAILQTVPEAILILGEDGRVSYANEKTRDLLDVEPEDIINRPPSEWCRNEDALAVLSRFESNISANNYADTMRIAGTAANDKKLAVKVYPVFSHKDSNDLYGRLVIIRDATKEFLAEESRSQFIAHVSHEIKSPLNALSLYTEALQGEQGESAEFRVEAYNVFNDEIERLAGLVDNMLSISKIEMGSMKVEKQRVRLQDLLEDCFQHVSRNAKSKNIDLKLDVPKEISAIAVDKDLLRMAINNLLTNAIKYSGNKGTVTLAAIESDTSIEIHVADEGIGISSDDIPKVFDKFFRSDDKEVRAIAGHGLGLALTKDIVELHGGEVSVQSQPNKGSDFAITLWKNAGLLRQAI